VAVVLPLKSKTSLAVAPGRLLSCGTLVSGLLAAKSAAGACITGI
jgi:hypothetical protein